MDSIEQPLRVVEVRGPVLTERLVLRPFVLDDLDDLLRYEQLPPTLPTGQPEAHGRPDFAAELERKIASTRLERADDRLDLAIELPAHADEPARVIGEVGFRLANPQDRQVRLSCTVHPDHRGNGYAMEAATRMLDFAFTEVGIHRVLARFDARGTASARLATRLGMRHEAHLVHDSWFDGQWVDTAIYGILDVEWAARKSIDGL